MKPYYEEPGIAIFHGDCRDVLPTIDPAMVALVIADPPYGIAAVERDPRPSGVTLYKGTYAGIRRDWTPIAGDDQPFDPDHLLCFRRLVLFGANNYADRLPASGAWLVWDKRNDAAPDRGSDAELAWTNIPGPIRMHRQCWRGYSREDDALDPQKHLHPTQKPTKLMIWLLQRFTKPGDLIVDPYTGSGPVPFACKLLGRRCIAVDIAEEHCRTAVRRLQQSVLPWEIPA